MKECVKNICSNYCADASAAIYCKCEFAKHITETVLWVQINCSEDLNLQLASRTETIHFLIEFTVLMNVTR